MAVWSNRKAQIRNGLLRNRYLLLLSAGLLFVMAGTTGNPAGVAFVGAALSTLLLVIAAVFVPNSAVEPNGDVRPVSDADNPLRRLSAWDLASGVPDPLIVFSRDGTLVHANDVAHSAFGPLSESVSIPLKFRAPEMQKLMDSVLSTGSRNEIDYAERVPLERWYRVSASPLGSESEFFAMIFRDQSETRRIERMRADFVANASHELRTPLASISGFIETLKGPARNDVKAREKFLQIMEDQTARMARLIDDLLSLSRIEMKPYFKPNDRVSLPRLLDNVVDALRPLAAELGVMVETSIPPDGFEVFGERDELIQVFGNLLENACKYGQSGGRVIIGLTMTEDEGNQLVVAEFRDFGPGIASEHIPRLTERFYRVDMQKSRDHKGTGLGLSIVKHILTRHGARLVIESEPGEGSVFRVIFPTS